MKFEKRIQILSGKESDENNDEKSSHEILVCDPLASVLEFGNGD